MPKQQSVRAEFTQRFGIVSEGTFRNEDLIPCFAGELRSLLNFWERHKQHAPPNPTGAINEVLAILDDIECAADAQGEEYYEVGGSWDVLWLADTLEQWAHPDFYFGASDGDGACYGFWPVPSRD